jgi:hypothetical protein
VVIFVDSDIDLTGLLQMGKSETICDLREIWGERERQRERQRERERGDRERERGDRERLRGLEKKKVTLTSSTPS